MASSTDSNRDSLSNTAHAAPNPKPFQFGLKGLFALTAAVSVLAAGARSEGIGGFLLAAWSLCFACWIWARITKRRRLGEWFSRLSVYGFIFGVLPALLLPAVDRHRGRSRRTICENNLRNLGMALLVYGNRNGSFPPVYTIDTNGKPLMSWRTAILPLIERQDVNSSYRADEPWDSPSNKPLSLLRLEIFDCSSDDGPFEHLGTTSYVAVIGPHSAWGIGKGVPLTAIKDGLADTLLLVEMKNAGIAWSEPRDLDLTNLPPGITPQNLLQALSNHAGGFNALFADGHVEFIPATIPWPQFLALTTIDGGEIIDRSTW